jgi:hypothetical protein
MVAEVVVGEVSFLRCSTLTSAKLDVKDDMEVAVDAVAVEEEEAVMVVAVAEVVVVEDTVEVGMIMDMAGDLEVEAGVGLGVAIDGK